MTQKRTVAPASGLNQVNGKIGKDEVIPQPILGEGANRRERRALAAQRRGKKPKGGTAI